MKVIGILLILIGVAGVVYGGFSYTTRKRAVDLGPVQIDKQEHHAVPIPPILGLAAMAGGGLLVFYGAKEGR